jgi:histidinol-phosphate aminotransferase
MEEILQRWAQALKTQGTLVRHTGGGLRVTIGSTEENQRTLARLLFNPTRSD